LTLPEHGLDLVTLKEEFEPGGGTIFSVAVGSLDSRGRIFKNDNKKTSSDFLSTHSSHVRTHSLIFTPIYMRTKQRSIYVTPAMI